MLAAVNLKGQQRDKEWGYREIPKFEVSDIMLLRN